MPSFHEVRFYLGGLWLLIKGDAQGLRSLDISDRGMMRSFWAFVWCLPAAFVYWNWLRLAFLETAPSGTKAGIGFFMRLFLIEAINWVLPLVLVGALCLLLNIERKFTAIVVATNWFSVPLAYVSAVLTLALIFIPPLEGVIVLLQLVLLIATIFAVSRLLRIICGQQPLAVTTLVLGLFIPALVISDLLQSFLGVSAY